MNLALSNFAWDNEDSELIFKTLKENNIHQIECVLTKLKPWNEMTPKVIIDYYEYLKSNGITPYSIQSLFYGVQCENLTEVNKVIDHFTNLIGFSILLGVKVLVFGSPNLRKKTDTWETDVVKVFKEVDEMLENHDIKLMIEPNAKSYGGEYFNTSDEIVEFIKVNEFKNIMTMIDTHNSMLEGQNPSSELYRNFDYIGHVHVSEPKLVPIVENDLHIQFVKSLKDNNYNKTITFEVMKCVEIHHAIKLFSKIYK
jgi:sugar phosphate isomerase/epimerase